MKRFYTMMVGAFMAMTAMAQETNDTTYVMMDFTQNPWNYPVTEVTKGWNPDYTDWTSPGAILTETDFSWPISNGSTEKVKVTVYSVDLDEFEKVPPSSVPEAVSRIKEKFGISLTETPVRYWLKKKGFVASDQSRYRQKQI